MFRNNIGKTLYDGMIAKNSKMKRVVEKIHKNQLKVAVIKKDEQTKKFAMQFCLINFRSAEDLKEFETKFQAAIDELKSK